MAAPGLSESRVSAEGHQCLSGTSSKPPPKHFIFQVAVLFSYKITLTVAIFLQKDGLSSLILTSGFIASLTQIG